MPVKMKIAFGHELMEWDLTGDLEQVQLQPFCLLIETEQSVRFPFVP